MLLNNWMTWHYNNDPTQKFRTSDNDVFDVSISSYKGPVADLRTECIKSARTVNEQYPNEKYCLLLSGGSESEILVRSFLEAKVPFEVFVFKYEDDLNIYDVSHAVRACDSMGINYNLINFNVKRFFENDAAEYSKKSQIIIPPLLVQLPLCEMVDGIPIMGGGELVLDRTDDDYSKKGIWVLGEWEYNWGWEKYFHLMNRPAIVDWCRWSPSQFLSWMNLDWFKKLTSDEYSGKLGIDTTKIHGYREAWPELEIRKKSYGLESIDSYMYELFNELYQYNKQQSFGGDRYVNYKPNHHPYDYGPVNYAVFYTPEEFSKLVRS